MKTLLIGCGNIGALYDWESLSIKTYAKCLSKLRINFDLFDKNILLARKVAKKYKVIALENLNQICFSSYDLVIISTPTKTHFEYLNNILSDPPKLIICEKPIDTDIKRLTILEDLYKRKRVRVLVNYHRSFIPKFNELSLKIKSILKNEECNNISITYQRGFHNNGSHAIDLLTKLFDKTFVFENSSIIQKDFDEIEDDPTCTISSTWNGTRIVFIGLSNSKFSHFEISIYFSTKMINILEGGDRIEFYSLQKSEGRHYPFLKREQEWKNIMDNYMLCTIKKAIQMIDDISIKDNFLNSIVVSKSILSLISLNKK